MQPLKMGFWPQNMFRYRRVINTIKNWAHHKSWVMVNPLCGVLGLSERNPTFEILTLRGREIHNLQKSSRFWKLHMRHFGGTLQSLGEGMEDPRFGSLVQRKGSVLFEVSNLRNGKFTTRKMDSHTFGQRLVQHFGNFSQYQFKKSV